jgi:hypothetical protein
MKRNFIDRFSIKYSNIKFRENSFNRSRVIFHCVRTDGRTDGSDEANSRFFRNFANPPKKKQKNKNKRVC